LSIAQQQQQSSSAAGAGAPAAGIVNAMGHGMKTMNELQ